LEFVKLMCPLLCYAEVFTNLCEREASIV